MIRSNGLRNTGGLQGKGMSRGNRRINPYGRIAKERHERKQQWEAEHPPLINGQGIPHYFCHICLYFNESVTIAFVAYDKYVLEHIIPKGRLELDESQEDRNLGPSHVWCNNEKGTRELWEMEKSPKSGLPNPYPTWPAYAEYLLYSGKK